jgi:dTMP kinase
MIVSSQQFQPQAPRGFIVLEGVNGAGKTSLQQKIADWLLQRGKTPLITREPGATPLGKAIRSLVLETKGEAISTMAELMLFGADRAEHVNKVILPALSRSEWVICDRYFYSSIAFQGYGRGIPLDKIHNVNTLATGGVVPDLTVLLDLDPLIGLARAKGRQDLAKDTFEAEEVAFHERVRSGFLQVAKERPEPFALIDASTNADAVFSSVVPFLDVLTR